MTHYYLFDKLENRTFQFFGQTENSAAIIYCDLFQTMLKPIDETDEIELKQYYVIDKQTHETLFETFTRYNESLLNESYMNIVKQVTTNCKTLYEVL